MGLLIARSLPREQAKRLVAEEIDRGHLHEHVIADTGPGGRPCERKVLRLVPAKSGADQTSPADYERLLERSGLSLPELAEALQARGVHVNKQSCYAWRKRRIPPAYERTVREVLIDAARARLIRARCSRGMTQTEAAALVGRSDRILSYREIHPDTGPDDQWRELIAALERIEPTAAVDYGPPLTAEELGQALEATGMPKDELARRVGVSKGFLRAWFRSPELTSSRPIPAPLWRPLREAVQSYSPPAACEHAREVVLPAVLELIERQPGISVSVLRRELPFGHASLTRAVAIGVGEKRLHTRPNRDRGREVIGLYPEPQEQPGSRIERLLPETLAVIEEWPGIAQKALRDRLRVDPKVAREVVAAAISAGEVRWVAIPYVDSAGRPRRRQGLERLASVAEPV